MIHTFYGIQANIGTTMVSQSVAECLAKANKNRNILLLHLTNIKNMEYFPSYTCGTLDDISIKLHKNLLTTEDISVICHRVNNLYVLPGVREYFIPDNVVYSVEMAMNLIHLVRHAYGEVIIDAGSNIHFKIAAGALMNGDKNYLLITQSEKSLARLEESKPHLDELGIRWDGTIVNLYTRLDPHNEKYLEKRLKPEGLDRFFYIHKDSNEIKAVKDKCTLLKSKQFLKEIMTLAKEMEGVDEADRQH